MITVSGHPTESALFFDELNNTSEYIDGKCVFMDIETGVFTIQPCISKPNTPLPFVCKRIDDKPCPTIDRGEFVNLHFIFANLFPTNIY